MTKINTDEIREKIKRLRSPITSTLNERFNLEEIEQYADEIDRLEKEQGKVWSELERWHVEQIEQRTKEEIKARIISSFAGHDIHSLDPVNITIDEILEAVDSAGKADG